MFYMDSRTGLRSDISVFLDFRGDWSNTLRFRKQAWSMLIIIYMLKPRRFKGDNQLSFESDSSFLQYDLDLLPACANPAPNKGISNFEYVRKNEG